MSTLAREYAGLIQAFLDEALCPEEFQEIYLRKFKDERRPMTELQYDVLNGVFIDLDCFYPGGLASIGPSLDEVELRRSVNDRYNALKAQLPTH